MKAELKRLHSPDVADLRSFSPKEPEHFSILVQAMVGPAGKDDAESFDIVVCSAAELRHEAEKGPVLGLHRIVMQRYDYQELDRTIRAYCAECEGATWQDVARLVGRIGRWEFEDYKE